MPARSTEAPIDFGWFLPSMGDAEVIGPPTREATLDYLVDVAKTAEDAGFTYALDSDFTDGEPSAEVVARLSAAMQGAVNVAQAG